MGLKLKKWRDSGIFNASASVAEESNGSDAIATIAKQCQPHGFPTLVPINKTWEEDSTWRIQQSQGAPILDFVLAQGANPMDTYRGGGYPRIASMTLVAMGILPNPDHFHLISASAPGWAIAPAFLCNTPRNWRAVGNKFLEAPMVLCTRPDQKNSIAEQAGYDAQYALTIHSFAINTAEIIGIVGTKVDGDFAKHIFSGKPDPADPLRLVVEAHCQKNRETVDASAAMAMQGGNVINLSEHTAGLGVLGFLQGKPQIYAITNTAGIPKTQQELTSAISECRSPVCVLYAVLS